MVRPGMSSGSASAEPSLRPLLAERRIVICVGSGGVGKTTTSATLALLGALSGRRVLALTIDPARRLADTLGLQALGHDIQRVPDEKLAEVAARRGENFVPGAGQLYAMMLDQKRAFDEVVKRYAKDPTLHQRILNNGIYRQISASLAGSHEYAAMSKLYDLALDSSWDLIVLDTPPTENALDFLDAPERLSEAVDSPALQWFIKPYLQQAGSWGLRLFGVGGAFVLRGLARFVGSQFLQQMAEFFVEFAEVTAGFRERAQSVQALLRRADSSFVLVCSPESLSIEEACYFHDRLVQSAMPLGGVVVNRVNIAGPPNAEIDNSAAPALVQWLSKRPELGGFLRDDVERLAADLQRTYREQQAVAAADAAAIERLRKKIVTTSDLASPPRPALPICRVPMLEHDIHDAAGLALISQYLA